MIWSHWSVRLFSALIAVVIVAADGGLYLGTLVAVLVVSYEVRLPHE